MAELEDAMAAWHLDHEHRFAVCVGSKAQMREVCARLEQQRVPWKPYSGETGEKDRLEDLKDPDATWIEFGAIVSTTTLSIGVDPKRVQFARVFVWTCRVGCGVLAQFQAAQRFGRSAAAPLLSALIRHGPYRFGLACATAHATGRRISSKPSTPAAQYHRSSSRKKLAE